MSIQQVDFRFCKSDSGQLPAKTCLCQALAQRSRRRAAQLRYRLLPYLYGLAWRGTQEGYIMMRGLAMDFPDQSALRKVDDVYMFGPAILDAARAIEPSARGELEITDAIQRLIDDGHRVESHTVSGWWKDTGQLADMLEANRLVLEDIDRRVDGELVGGGR